MPDLKNTLIRWYLRNFYPPDFSSQRSLQEQKKNFNSIITSLTSTALGKDHRLQAVKSYEDFQGAVPVTQYDFYEKYIERIKAGEERVMTAGKVLWFGKTAGTTSGKSKLIPVTLPFIHRCHVRGTFFGLSRLHGYDKTVDILSHKNFVMTGGVYETLPSSGIRIADISAIMMYNVPLPFRNMYAPDRKLVTHPSWDYKINQIVEHLADTDVGSLIGIPTWHLAVLSSLREHKHFNKLNELWKNLRLFIHGGVNFEPYRQHFKELSGRDDFIFYEVYNATEGFFGAQAEPDSSDLLLLTDTGVYYEFIPFRDYRTEREKAISLSDVQTGIPYVLLISTLIGLLRYVIGDVITFSATEPYRFRIVGRTQEYINAFGEDLLLHNVERALSSANEKSGSRIREFTVAPFYIHLNEKGKIQFVIEFDKSPPDLDSYSHELDLQLQKENSNYAQKRNKDIALSPLEVIVVKPGTFYHWLKSKGKLGGQNKVPRLVNGRGVIEEVLAITTN